MATTYCPDQAALQAFAIGVVGEARLDSLAAHIGQCASCQDRLGALDDADDAVMQRLRNLPPSRQDLPKVVADAGLDLARRLRGGPVRLDRFELQAELGVGSFGYVFRAWDSRLERLVALKVQRAGSFASPDEVQRFLREARSAAPLKHPAIVSLYETGQTEEGVGYLVCEYIDGVTLDTRLSAGPLAPTEAATLAAELAEALDYAHQHGVIHRDIKPANIILDLRQRPHLMDFGLAKQQSGDKCVTSEGRLLGTPAYMSPEQARGASHETDARSDIYSLGVVLYEMLAGRRPFQGDRRQLLLAVAEEDPQPPRRARPGVPRDLEVICLKAMSKAPISRYQQAGDLAADLRRFLHGQPILARPMGPAERMVRWCRRYPLAVSVLAAVLLGSAVGLAYLSNLSEYFVRQTALESARMETKILDEAWRFYSEEIQDIDPKTTNVKITENYKLEHASLPLPASFAIDLAERISRRTPGAEFRVYSRYPWPGRKDGGPQTQFDVAALEYLEARADPADQQPAEFARFVSDDGRRKLLYYSARHMEQSCLGCHNHPQGLSPKKDWKVGDVVGVFKLVRPLDQEIENTHQGLRGALVLMGTLAALLVAASVSATIVNQRRRKGPPV